MTNQNADNVSVAALGLRLGVDPINMDVRSFIRTLEGQQLIRESKVFAMEGTLWQGFKGKCVGVDDDQVSAQELGNAIDVDGSLDKVLKRLRSAANGLAKRIAKEQDEKDAIERKKQLDEMQLKKLQIETGTEVTEKELDAAPAPKADQPSPLEPKAPTQSEKLDTVITGLGSLTQAVTGLVQTLQQPAGDPEVPPVMGEVTYKPRVRCKECKKQSPPRHRAPSKWLAAHRLGAHTAKGPQAVAAAK